MLLKNVVSANRVECEKYYKNFFGNNVDEDFTDNL